MPTEKQTIAYIKKRIKIYTESEKLYLNLVKTNPSLSRRYNERAQSAAAARLSLEYVLTFIDTGEEDVRLKPPAPPEPDPDAMEVVVD